MEDGSWRTTSGEAEEDIYLIIIMILKRKFANYEKCFVCPSNVFHQIMDHL